MKISVMCRLFGHIYENKRMWSVVCLRDGYDPRPKGTKLERIKPHVRGC